MKFCFRICPDAPLHIALTLRGEGSETRPSGGRRDLAKGVGLDSHGRLEDRGLVPNRDESQGERKGKGQRAGWRRKEQDADRVESRAPRGRRGLRGGRAAGAPGSAHRAYRRAGCRKATEAQGGDLRDTDRGVADARPHRGREPERVPAQLGRSRAGSRERWAQRAFPDTPPGSLKGPRSPGLSPFLQPQKARSVACRSAPARLHRCPWSCPLLLGSPGGQGRFRRCWSLSHFLEGLCHSPRPPLCLFPWPLQIA